MNRKEPGNQLFLIRMKEEDPIIRRSKFNQVICMGLCGFPIDQTQLLFVCGVKLIKIVPWCEGRGAIVVNCKSLATVL